MFSKKSMIKEKVVKYNADKIVKYLCNSKKIAFKMIENLF